MGMGEGSAMMSHPGKAGASGGGVEVVEKRGRKPGLKVSPSASTRLVPLMGILKSTLMDSR